MSVYRAKWSHVHRSTYSSQREVSYEDRLNDLWKRSKRTSQAYGVGGQWKLGSPQIIDIKAIRKLLRHLSYVGKHRALQLICIFKAFPNRLGPAISNGSDLLVEFSLQQGSYLRIAHDEPCFVRNSGHD